MALYKVINGKPPFKDEETLARFTSAFTAQALLTAGGLSRTSAPAAGQAPAARSTSAQDSDHDFLLGIGIMNLLASSVLKSARRAGLA